jgi:hypothetical protein
MTSERLLTDALGEFRSTVAALSERVVELRAESKAGFERIDAALDVLRTQLHDDAQIIGRHDSRIDSLESTRDTETGRALAVAAIRRGDLVRITVGVSLINLGFVAIAFFARAAGMF